MTPKQARFVAEYLIDLNATQAAIRAGYHPKMAAKLVAKGSIAEAIAAGQAKQLERADLSAARVLEELRRIAFFDVRRLFDARGHLKPLHRLTAEEAACIGSFEVVKKQRPVGPSDPSSRD
jgi:phage terminase small subunit